MTTTYQLTSGHLYLVEDERGELVDAIVFCSDWCHQYYCEQQGLEYMGWNGCHELDAPQWCASCENPLRHYPDDGE